MHVDYPELARFDNCINELNKFERIRYPDKMLREGMVGGTRWQKEDLNAGKLSLFGWPLPRYEVSIDELDELVMAIYSASNTDPQLIEMQMFPGVAKEYYHDRNKSLPLRDDRRE